MDVTKELQRVEKTIADAMERIKQIQTAVAEHSKKVEKEEPEVITDVTKWKDVLKTGYPTKISVRKHSKYPNGPFAYLSWEPPKASAFEPVGYMIETNGYRWPVREYSTRRVRLRAWKDGSYVRIGAVYSWHPHQGVSWACRKYWRK